VEKTGFCPYLELNPDFSVIKYIAQPWYPRSYPGYYIKEIKVKKQAKLSLHLIN
jgi:hypothetical protein